MSYKTTTQFKQRKLFNMLSLHIPLTNIAISDLIMWVLGIALLVVASKFSIPLQPVPVTLQPNVVMLLAITYSPVLAMSTVYTWFILGALGVPVFAGTLAGVVYLTGPTGGYLMSYLVVVPILSAMAERLPRKFFSLLLMMSFAVLINFIFGGAWLSALVGIEKAIALGILPFVIPGMVKIAIMATTLKAIDYFKKEV
jgi:biotin transport system substrate-specific component